MSLNSQSESQRASWRVSVGGKVYGPYTHHQMESFVVEGRVAAHSIVAADENGPWLAAGDDPVLASYFLANTHRGLDPAPKPKLQPVADPIYVTDAKTQGMNFIIVVDIKSRSGYGFERELNRLGESYRHSSSVYLLRSDFPISAVRNSLTPHLGKTDSLLVVEAHQGRSAWFNLGAQAEAHIRKLWQRGPNAG